MVHTFWSVCQSLLEMLQLAALGDVQRCLVEHPAAGRRSIRFIVDDNSRSQSIMT